MLTRMQIGEPGRYYHHLRTIVLRKGLLLAEERRYLWHELVHADREDRACHVSAKVERSVEREAARRAMPTGSITWAIERSHDLDDLADHLKVPAEWVGFRLQIAHPAERQLFLRSLPEDYCVRGTQF